MKTQKETITEKIKNVDVLDLTLNELIIIKKLYDEDTTFKDQFEPYVINDIILGLQIYKQKFTKQQWLNLLTELVEDENYEDAADVRDFIEII